ncbi:MAG: ferredoxin--NADP reductase [Pseudomonadales bacterium]
MSSLRKEQVLSVHHWNDTLFSFRTTRDPGFRFESGHFAMMGLEHEGKPLMRAYSLASAHYEEELEFFSIKVADGPLTSRLQSIQPGDEVLVSQKATGTLVADRLLPGKNLYLLGTGTGLAPFLSIIKDPAVYEAYEKIVLVHGVRTVSELAYQNVIKNELPHNEFFGDEVREKLIYYPTVTREPFENNGRITDLLRIGKLAHDVGLPPVNPQDDRFMLCGSPSMLKDLTAILDAKGFDETLRGDLGHYVIERAFVES